MTKLQIDLNIEGTFYTQPDEFRLIGGADKADHIVELCKRNKVKPRSLLEVGAGDGAILQNLSRRSFCQNMHAVELSQSGVDVINAQQIPGLITCQVFNGYEISAEDNAFDLVILSHVFEHVELERVLLREISRVSKMQIIEIPMDCNHIANEYYKYLGPSYGHINAYTPHGLQYLLWTEEIDVLDFITGQYSTSIFEYYTFVSRAQPKTPSAISALHAQHVEVERQLADAPPSERSKHASFHAVLTKRLRAEDKIVGAVKAIKQLLQEQRPGEAELIFNHWIPQPLIDATAIDLSDFCLPLDNDAFLRFLAGVTSEVAQEHVSSRIREQANREPKVHEQAAERAPNKKGLKKLVSDVFQRITRN